jgi:hypothetical protein
MTVIRMSAVVVVLVLMSMSVRACQSLPALKQHPVYSLVAEQGAVLPVLD